MLVVTRHILSRIGRCSLQDSAQNSLKITVRCLRRIIRFSVDFLPVQWNTSHPLRCSI